MAFAPAQSHLRPACCDRSVCPAVALPARPTCDAPRCDWRGNAWSSSRSPGRRGSGGDQL